MRKFILNLNIKPSVKNIEISFYRVIYFAAATSFYNNDISFTIYRHG